MDRDSGDDCLNEGVSVIGCVTWSAIASFYRRSRSHANYYSVAIAFFFLGDKRKHRYTEYRVMRRVKRSLGKVTDSFWLKLSSTFADYV